MPDDSAIISVDNVSKDFVLPHEKVGSVKSAFTGIVRRRSKRSVEMQHALRGISFDIKKGEFFGIVGRNGSGKSTLLKIIAGIYQPTKGAVTTKGKLVPFIELGVGFNPDLTGRENVYLNGAMLGFSRKEVDAMYDSIVEFAELEKFMDQKLKNYSSGMQVRLAFSVAIRADADILIIDEVLAVGDAAFQRKCLSYFRQLKKDAKTVVFVSHDMDSVRQFCDRAALIEKSKVVTIDSSDRVAELYSKMFAKEAQEQARKDSGNEPTESSRWGSGSVIIRDPTINSKVVTDEIEYLEFGGTLEFKKTIDKPVLGFKIVDGSGKPIAGTNTRLIHVNTSKYEAGSEVLFTWKIPNIFSNDNYELSLAIVSQTGATYDIWNDALKFEVLKSIKTPYIVTPKVEVTIKNSAKKVSKPGLH